MEADALVSNGTASQAMMGFLRAAVRARLNIVVSGGTGAGKTTTLNALSAFIQDGERIITIEDAAELKLRQLHVLSLETRPANVEGRGQISVRDLVISALRMRPDRLVVGECRGAEAMDMLQAMSTGHDGSLTTLHASSAKEAITRLETMVLWAGTDLPMRAIRSQVVNAIDLVVQQNRLRDGSRRIVSISEVSGLEDGEVVLHDLFRFDQQGMDDEGRVIGAHSACARIPSRAKDIVAAGESIDPLSFLTTSGGLTAMQEHRRRLHDWIPDAPAAAPLLLHGERRRPELSVVGRRSLRRIAQPA
jgi:pilus assembly protein CpaF